MSDYKKLSEREIILAVVTLIIIVIDIILALCIGLVLPKHFISDKYVSANQTKEDLYYKCKCYRLVKDQEKSLVNNVQFRSSEFNTDNKLIRNKRNVENKHPYLVSLTIPVFKDNKDFKMLACEGVIISENMILTGNNCVKNYNEWNEIEIRSGSEYWSKGGIIQKVQHIKKIADKLVIINVYPNFNLKDGSTAKIGINQNFKWIRAFTITWDPLMYRKPINFRRKYGKPIIENWTSVLCANTKPILMSDKSDCCNLIFGKPLITSCNLITGFQMAPSNTILNQLSFYNLNNKMFITFLTRILSKYYKFDSVLMRFFVFKDICMSTMQDVCN